MKVRKTKAVTARIEPEYHARFGQRAKSHDMTESQLLRFLVLMAIDEPAGEQPEALPTSSNDVVTRMTLRLPHSLHEAVKVRAKSKGMAPSRFVSALVKSNLSKQPVVSDAELAVLRASNRELAAIGRNINQIAKSLNEAFHETERVRLDKLEALKRSIEDNRTTIDNLINAVRKTWEASP